MQELKLYTRTEQLLYKIYPALVNFPKVEKFALCEYIKDNFFELLKCISLANNEFIVKLVNENAEKENMINVLMKES